MGEGGERLWLARQASDELKTWGRTGVAEGRIVLKSDGEASVVALRDALVRFHGGVCVSTQDEEENNTQRSS